MKDFELIYASQLRAKQRESRALVIDIRDRKEYESEHWPGAVSYPYDQLERGRAVILHATWLVQTLVH